MLGIRIKCRHCGEDFSICGHCYRNQGYCSKECRTKGFNEPRRRARKKHAESEEAKQDAKDRQNRYRKRKNEDPKNMTDQTSAPPSSNVEKSDTRLHGQTHVCVVCRGQIKNLCWSINEYLRKRRYRHAY
jgi:hypothetical protein